MAVKITLTNVGVNISNLLDIWVSSGGTGGTFELYQTDISKIELMNGYVISSPPFGVNAYQIKDNNCLQVLTLGCGLAPTTTTTTTAATTTAATTAAPTTAAPTTATPPTTDATTSAGTFTATVSINGYPEYGETLTAKVTNSNCTGTLSYQWKQNGANVGSDSSTYLLGINDIDTNISVVVSCYNRTGTVSSSYVSVTKRHQATPSAPSIHDYTYNSITLYIDSDALYSIDDGDNWQESNTFSGLNPETEYCIISYYPVTSTHFASDISSQKCQTTYALPAFSGTASITGTEEYNQTLSVSVNVVGSCSGTITYQWRRGTTDIVGATDSTYTIVQEDINSQLSIVVSCTEETGNIISWTDGVIAKRSQNVATWPPVLDNKTDTSITFTTPENDYSRDGGNTWQKNVFTGLECGTEYTFVRRYAETDVYQAGLWSSPTKISTDSCPTTATPTTETPTTATPTTATPIYDVWLGYDDDTSIACSNYNNHDTYWYSMNSPIFESCTRLYIHGTTDFAPSGAYSDGTIWKGWNGVSMVIGGSCPAPTTAPTTSATPTTAPTTSATPTTAPTTSATPTTAPTTTTTHPPTTTTTTTDTHSLYTASNTTYGDSTQTCAANPDFIVELYGNRDFMYQIETFYTNKSLTIPFNGNGFWYKVSHDWTLYAVQIDEGGGVVTYTTCGHYYD